MQSGKTCRMSQNAKLTLWSHFKAISKLFPELFELFLYDIHIQSYYQMMLSIWDIMDGSNIGTILSHFSKCHFATSDGFSCTASHIFWVCCHSISGLVF